MGQFLLICPPFGVSDCIVYSCAAAQLVQAYVSALITPGRASAGVVVRIARTTTRTLMFNHTLVMLASIISTLCQKRRFVPASHFGLPRSTDIIRPARLVRFEIGRASCRERV